MSDYREKINESKNQSQLIFGIVWKYYIKYYERVCYVCIRQLHDKNLHSRFFTTKFIDSPFSLRINEILFYNFNQ